ncbi:MAG TPA: hydrogenase maturation protease [Verrucomicrobiae bacterium]|nr:hydrogenase maturation protease [Verrucomicrobiae bacterium]
MELCLPTAEEPTNDVSSPDPARRRVLVLGVGNVLLGDEGVGVHAIQRLKACGLAAHADLLDGGTGGFHLLGCWRDYERLILIDAAADGHPPGTVSVLHPQYARDFPPSLSAHDIGLKDLIESAALLGPLPPLDLVTISVGELQPMSVALSPVVAAALPAVVRQVKALLTA